MTRAKKEESSADPPKQVTSIDLEFDTGATGQAPLGDIASSLVSVDELLRDLATIAAHASGVEYREIRVEAITMLNPLKVRLALVAIPIAAVKGFQEICRAIISGRPTRIDAALALCTSEGAHLTEQESQRMRGHIATLQAAKVPLRRIAIGEE